MEKIIINKAAKNEMVELYDFQTGIIDYAINTKQSISTFSMMFRNPDTGDLHMVSRVAVDQENKNIIIF